MKFKSLFAKPLAYLVQKQIESWKGTAVEDQEKIFNYLIREGRKTEFGRDHDFESIKTIDDFNARVPLRDYEALKEYIEKIKEGRHNVLWKGIPEYFAKTSGTTSGTKYIPISKDSIPNHIHTARNALLYYMAQSGNFNFANGKLIFLSGSPTLERVGGIPTGRLSGIVNHHIPSYLRSNQLPSFETNCIEDWEEKLSKIIDETINQDMRLISGIPPWMQMYFDGLTARTGKKIGELFPNFSVMVQGGVNFAPYKKKLFDSIGKEIDTLETYPASEGFFAFQDAINEPGLLLNTDSGIFYQFIRLSEIDKPGAERLWLKDVKVNENYALVISSNAGLWSYNLGDTVKFISTSPYKLVVTGRTKHYISAFGEHVIGEEVEAAIEHALKVQGGVIREFTVAPNISQGEGKSYHDWFIEFEKEPQSMEDFKNELDHALRERNVYYDDLISGNILQTLNVNRVLPGGFADYMKSIGKLGGQNKVPRLSNKRELADGLQPFISNSYS